MTKVFRMMVLPNCGINQFNLTHFQTSQTTFANRPWQQLQMAASSVRHFSWLEAAQNWEDTFIQNNQFEIVQITEGDLHFLKVFIQAH